MREAERKLAEGLEEVLSYKRDETNLKTYTVPMPNVSIRSIREQLHLSQAAFSKRFHVPLGTLQGWEQGRREPDYVARVFLKLIETNPQKVDELISDAGVGS